MLNKKYPCKYTSQKLPQTLFVRIILQEARKKELLHKLPGISVEEKARKKTDPERESARLERKIGQLTMEVEWLEKKCKQLGIPVNE
jgi:hypothetical protein